jgi:TPR repeat protein
MKKYLILFLVLFAGAAFSADIAALTKAANTGKADAQYELAKAYLDEGEDGKAAEWFEKAARQGHAQAQYELGTLQFFGWDGVEGDKLKGCGWLYLAAGEVDSSEYLCLLQLSEKQKSDAIALSKELAKSIKKK